MQPSEKYEEYRPLTHDDESASESLGSDTTIYMKRQPVVSLLRPDLWKTLAITAALVLSLAIGLVFGSQLQTKNTSGGLSPYLNLEYSSPTQLWWNTEYSAEDATDAEMNKLWDADIPWERGIIALSNEEADAMNLPESQPFPWDASRKRIYIVNAHHLLHCVRNIYISIQQYRTNKTQTIDYAHILHCLDSLRVETMCTADDTLRYVPLNSAHGFRPGDGQKRMCRDWNRVEEFVRAHDPCYQYLRPGDKDLSNLERFKFCPAESEYLPKIRGYFGYGDNWTPEPPDGPRELEW
ncbi:hypothetical protein AAE478_008244 [Parahypoxylon ruwenzoriense]